MLKFDFSMDLPDHVPYMAVVDGEDIIFVASDWNSGSLPMWLRQAVLDRLTECIDSPPGCCSVSAEAPPERLRRVM